MATSNHKINIWINLHFERWNFEHWSFKCEMIVIALEWGLGHDINLGLNQLIWDLDQVQVQLQAFQAFSNKPRSINNLLVYASLATTEVTDANPFASLATKWDGRIISILSWTRHQWNVEYHRYQVHSLFAIPINGTTRISYQKTKGSGGTTRTKPMLRI